MSEENELLALRRKVVELEESNLLMQIEIGEMWHYVLECVERCDVVEKQLRAFAENLSEEEE